MALVKTKDAKVGLYGAFPADMVYGLLRPSSNLGGYNVGLFDTSTDGINYYTGANDGLFFATSQTNSSNDIVTGKPQIFGNSSITNTSSTNIINITVNDIKGFTKTVKLVNEGLVFGVVGVYANNNTSGDTTYWTPYITVNYVNNSVVNNIVPKTNLGQTTTTSTSVTYYGQIITYVLPNDIVIPANSYIQTVIQVDGYVSAGSGYLGLGTSTAGDLSGNGTWFSLPVEVE